MLKKCMNCEKEFEDDTKKFCSLQCEVDYNSELRRKLDELIKNDKGHTDKLKS